MLIRCTGCEGKRTLIGLGGIKKDCPTCKGVGFVAEEEKEAVKIKRKKAVKKEVEEVLKNVENSEEISHENMMGE